MEAMWYFPIVPNIVFGQVNIFSCDTSISLYAFDKFGAILLHSSQCYVFGVKDMNLLKIAKELLFFSTWYI